MQDPENSLKCLVVIGTRPEAIKMAPVIAELNASEHCQAVVCLSGQHPEMAADALNMFGLSADVSLPKAETNGDLSVGMGHVLHEFAPVLHAQNPDWVLVHGDTMTTMSATVAAFNAKTKVAHVEAGLRTGDLGRPWPEEGYRKTVAALADFHFAPTDSAVEALLAEGVGREKISVTGNTVVDSLRLIADINVGDGRKKRDYEEWYSQLVRGKRLVLVTLHRRENQGDEMGRILSGLKTLAASFPDLQFVLPVHPNPAVSKPVQSELGGIENFSLIDPLEYPRFVFLLEHAHLVLTDSGGIQEEAPSFGTPVLVMRSETERPEAVAAGTARLVGSDPVQIVNHAATLLGSQRAYEEMATSSNPFGDGWASSRIVQTLERFAVGEAPYPSQSAMSYRRQRPDIRQAPPVH